jgi:CRP/FNR family transcriptional regulator, cyclic AMP receptor protein
MPTGLAERVERLRSIDLFSRLDHEALALVASLASELDVPAGLVLAEPKQPGSGMFAITEGRATAELRGGSTRELGPGDCFGELALVTPEGTRTARVRAETDLRCLAIAREDFRELLEREPRIALSMLEVLAARLAR